MSKDDSIGAIGGVGKGGGSKGLDAWKNMINSRPPGQFGKAQEQKAEN